MKITGNWKVRIETPVRFVVIQRDQNSITLHDTELGHCYKIVLENTKDFDNAAAWGDKDWWDFIFLKQPNF